MNVLRSWKETTQRLCVHSYQPQPHSLYPLHLLFICFTLSTGGSVSLWVTALFSSHWSILVSMPTDTVIDTQSSVAWPRDLPGQERGLTGLQRCPPPHDYSSRISEHKARRVGGFHPFQTYLISIRTNKMQFAPHTDYTLMVNHGKYPKR